MKLFRLSTVESQTMNLPGGKSTAGFAGLLRVLRVVGSLRLAVGLIAVCVGVLAWATLVEKSHGAAAAHFGVYDTPWFAWLGGLLAANVLAAMFVRFPWRRRQAGFLATHFGILVLLTGCFLSRQYGVDAQLPVVEGRTTHRAYQDSYHFRLEVVDDRKTESDDKADKGESSSWTSGSIDVPFAPGPFRWDRYGELPWFPWRLAYRSQGKLFDEDGISLEVLDFVGQPQFSARVRLTVDGAADELDVALSPDDGGNATKWPGVKGHGRRVAVALLQDEIDLGFQVHLRTFRRKLDPGAGTASHYSSLVDFLDRADSPQALSQQVLITLNAPVDFADPVSGRTYRLFQSAFDGPWLPGEPEFDRLTPSDRSRDQLYLSRLSVQYDPGRELKYIGSVLIVIGILAVYYLRPKTQARQVGNLSYDGVENSSRDANGSVRGKALILLLLMFTASACVCRADDNAALDWNAWRRMPALGEGRIVPVDSFARETVEAICGRENPVLAVSGGESRRYAAPELLFAWLAEPERWETVSFLTAQDERLRQEVLGLPLVDADGNRLRYATPGEVENCETLGLHWAELQKRAEAEGKAFRISGLDKSVKELVDAYAKFRLLTFDANSGKDAPRRFYSRLRSAGQAWQKLAGDLQAAKRISRDDEVRRLMVQAGESLQNLIGQVHGDDFSREKVERPVAAFRRVSEQLVARLADSKDKLLSGLAAELHRQTVEMYLALYDNGETLRLIPSLNPAALEENRSPGDDASPWLAFQPMVFGANELLRGYPRRELKAVRDAWADAKAAYVDRAAQERSSRFSRAMRRFSESVRALGEQIEPLRRKIVLQHADEDAIHATAYPGPGSTEIEVFYGRLNPFFWAWAISLAATLCLAAVGRLRKTLFVLGTLVLLIAETCAAAGLGLRAAITGLIPLTGMFETVVFVAVYAGLLGLWFAWLPMWRGRGELARIELVLRRRPFALAGAIVSFTAMVLAYYAPATVMHRNIGSVTPILRDNFWLAVHVVTIMASYASAAIALILGNAALGYYLFGRYEDRRPPEPCSVLAEFTYSAIQITVLLLAAGTILGAFWADKAWGRFWAWDPKETWALISLLVYVLILHARYVGWAGDFGMAVAAVLGATAVLFTWYGVNFVLGSGMHAYGSGSGGQWAVGTAVAAQWLFLLFAAFRYVGEVGTRSYRLDVER